MEQEYSANGPIRWAFVAFFVSCVASFAVHVCGWEELLAPMVFMTLVCLGACFLTIGIVILHYAWTLNMQQFEEWWIAQKLFGSRKKSWDLDGPALRHWASRFIGGPACCVGGLVWIVLGMLGIGHWLLY